MKIYTSVLVLLLLLIAIPDTFFYLKLKSKNAKPIFLFLHIGFALLFTVFFLYLKFELDRFRDVRIVSEIMWLYYFFLIIYITKLIHVIFYFLNYIYKKFSKHDSIYFNIIRIVCSVFVVATMLIGAYITPRNFEVTHIQIKIPSLPSGFNGYKIVQISDVHLGSWNRKFGKLKKVIKLINEQQPDIIVFTGDMVNNMAGETEYWQNYFRQLKSKNGKYAILGNHDYGDYVEWDSKKEYMENRLEINQSIRNFGFSLLLNENIYLINNGDSLLLVGVENWGKPGKNRYCDLNKALKGSKNSILKILLSHDPNLWEAEILGKKDIVLTLSGHTHAAQLGIKIGGRLISPASLVFKYWSGLYKVDNQYLYVNRGIGYIGLPMNIGVKPEITVIELIK